MLKKKTRKSLDLEEEVENTGVDEDHSQVCGSEGKPNQACARHCTLLDSDKLLLQLMDEERRQNLSGTGVNLWG